MSSRSYLSIGDVLTLLREEFPDVTISKIRFLESQGLVNPERSPSGYRKFFDHDVERLRWVLRQQREHFLPLKVIRDRLADGELDDPSAPAEAQVPPHVVNGKSSVQSMSTVGSIADPQTTADDEAMARIIADASRRAALLPDTSTAPRAVQVVARPAAAETLRDVDVSGIDVAVTPDQAAVLADTSESRRAAAVTSAGGPVPPQPAPGEQSSARPASVGPSAASETTTPPTSPASPTSSTSPMSPASPTPPARPAPPGATAAAGSAGTTSGGVSNAMVTGASMTAEEICAASGLDADELAGLESFGLVESVSVAGMTTYDEEALAIANLAAAFRVYGIEPRHLRQYRMAVDREMGLIEQVVIPLLRQRNPEARQRALEGAEQLAALGQSMQAALLRVALRHHLRG